MKPLIVTAASVMLSAALVAQDAARTLPDNYKVEFENELVRVTRVHYGPHAKLPAHTHTSLASAYVYLNDNGPVAFKHVGAEYGAVTRKPTRARSYRLYRGIDEIHEVENLSPRPSEFLRVEFKTDPVDPKSLRGVFLPPAQLTAATELVEFENAQLRVSRLTAPLGQSVQVAGAEHPSLIVSLVAGEAGQVTWVPRAHAHIVSTARPTALEALRFLLKTDVQTH